MGRARGPSTTDLPGAVRSAATDCRASDVDDDTEDPRFGRVGKQTIVDTGALTRNRMETIEDDLLARTLGLIDRAHESDTPFFLHFYPHARVDQVVGAVARQDRRWLSRTEAR